MSNPFLVRDSTEGRVAGGVASGIAKATGINVVMVRAAFIIAAILYGVGITAYVALWLATPTDSADGGRNARKVFLGTCGRFARVSGVDASAIRLAFALAFFLYGAGAFLYLVLSLAHCLSPEENR